MENKPIIQIQRTHRKQGNIIRIKDAEATKTFEELTLHIRGGAAHYLPLEAFTELLRHYKNNEPVVEVMVFLPEDFNI